jgi:hypothetical protein
MQKYGDSMAEIKTELFEVEEGKPYIPGPDEVVITEKHTIADIVRYALKCACYDKSEIQYILDEEPNN